MAVLKQNLVILSLSSYKSRMSPHCPKNILPWHWRLITNWPQYHFSLRSSKPTYPLPQSRGIIASSLNTDALSPHCALVPVVPIARNAVPSSFLLGKFLSQDPVQISSTLWHSPSPWPLPQLMKLVGQSAPLLSSYFMISEIFTGCTGWT